MTVMMPLGEAFYRGRVALIQRALSARDADGLLLLDAPSVVYASGFVHSVSERPVGLYIPASGAPTLFVPLLEQENAAETWISDIRAYFEYPGEETPLAWMIRECGAGARRVLFEGDSWRITAAVPPALRTDLVARLRWVKTPEELALIEQAARYADFCLEYLYAHGAAIIRDGGTELDLLSACVGATLEKMVAELGAQYGRRGLKVTGTVHSGPRAALPHGEPINRRPMPGEPIIAGIGAMIGGYHAESGATFVYGEPDAETLRCLRAAAACNDAAVEALRPGASCASVNTAALAVLREAGLGDAIRHRIGHGMGLEGHEAPWLAPGDETRVAPGMVFSNEPGIYRPGRDGYRTINTMIAVKDGPARVPSRFLAEHPPERRVLI
jgi:Xaa-Pro aminopeptidase